MDKTKFIPAKYLTNDEKNQIAFFKMKIRQANSKEEIQNYKLAIARIHYDLIKRIVDNEKNQKPKKMANQT